MELSRRTVLTGAAATGVLSTFSAGGCAPSSQSPGSRPRKPRRGGTIRVGVTGKASAIVRDPFGLQPNDSDYQILSLIYDTITVPGRSPLVRPRLATHWEPSADLRTWRFSINPDARFHDGTPCTAEDVAWSVQQLRRSPAGTSRLPGIGVDGVSADGKSTLVVRSDYPNSLVPLLFRLTTFVQKKGTTDPVGAPGTGPFKLDWFRDGNARLVRNDDWYGGDVHLDAIEIRMFSEIPAMANAVLSGEIDVASNVGAVAARSARGRGGVRIVRRPNDTALYIVMRSSDGPFADPRVREAFKLAADRDSLVAQSISGFGAVGNDILGVADPAYAKSIPQRHQDLSRARHLLEQARFDLSKTYPLVTTEEIPGMAESASVFTEQVKAIGVTLRVEKQDQATFLGTSRGKAQLYTSFNGIQDSVVICAGKLLISTAKLNEAAWHDSAFDAAYRAVIGSKDAAHATKLSHDMQRIQYERAGHLVWGVADGLDLAIDAVQGLPDLPGYGRVQLETAWLDS